MIACGMEARVAHLFLVNLNDSVKLCAVSLLFEPPATNSYPAADPVQAAFRPVGSAVSDVHEFVDTL
jgi:hypothetical protein